MFIYKIKAIYFALSISACFLLNTGNAQAIEALKYSDELSTSLRFQMNTFLQEAYKSDTSGYYISSVDLNNDGILEYILRRKSCDINKNQCTHIIIAEKHDRILLLSKIRAKKLMVGGSVSYGIKNLLAFNNNENDYNFNIYMWSPKKNMYIMSEQHIRD